MNAILGEICRRCEQPRGYRRAGRGLCTTCYTAVHRAGHLDDYPVAQRPSIPEIAGVSYRQLDYWVTSGYLHPEREVDGPVGSGIWRRWSDEELRVARVMARLVAAGLPPKTAAQVARGDEEIAPGVRVVVAS